MFFKITAKQIVNLNSIIYLKAQVNYTIFYFKDGTELKVSKTLKNYEEELKFVNFIRIDRSYIINTKFVLSLTKKDKNIEIGLPHNIKIQIARRRMTYFKKFASWAMLTNIQTKPDTDIIKLKNK